MVPSDPSRELWRGLGDAWSYLSYLITGILVWGGAGWGLDRLLDTQPVFVIVGTLIGNFGGIYLVYLRTSQAEEADRRAS